MISHSESHVSPQHPLKNNIIAFVFRAWEVLVRLKDTVAVGLPIVVLRHGLMIESDTIRDLVM